MKRLFRKRCTDADVRTRKNYRDDGQFGDSSGLMTLSACGPRLRRVTTLHRRVGRERYRCAVSMSPTRDRASVSTSSRYSCGCRSRSARTRSSARAAAIGAVPPDDLRKVRPRRAHENPILRERFLARFGESVDRSTSTVWSAETLLNGTLETIPVTAAIDFSHLFDLAEQYRTGGISLLRLSTAAVVPDDRRQRRAHRRADHYDDFTNCSRWLRRVCPRRGSEDEGPRAVRRSSRGPNLETRRPHGGVRRGLRRSKRDGDPVQLDDRIHLGLNLHRSELATAAIDRKVLVRPPVRLGESLERAIGDVESSWTSTFDSRRCAPFSSSRA